MSNIGRCRRRRRMTDVVILPHQLLMLARLLSVSSSVPLLFHVAGTPGFIQAYTFYRTIEHFLFEISNL